MARRQLGLGLDLRLSALGPYRVSQFLAPRSALPLRIPSRSACVILEECDLDV